MNFTKVCDNLAASYKYINSRYFDIQRHYSTQDLQFNVDFYQKGENNVDIWSNVALKCKASTISGISHLEAYDITN